MGRFHYNPKGYPVWNNSGLLVHRTVAKPKGDQITHHKDGNPKNFRKSNLVNMSKSEHAKLHAREK
jgi:hypothetical protein